MLSNSSDKLRVADDLKRLMLQHWSVFQIKLMEKNEGILTNYKCLCFGRGAYTQHL